MERIASQQEKQNRLVQFYMHLHDTPMQQLENTTRLPRLKRAADLLPEAPATKPKKVNMSSLEF